MSVTRYVPTKRIVVAHLKAVLPERMRVVTTLPEPFGPDRLPLVRVMRSPGDEQDGHTARPHVDIHCFHTDESALEEVTEAAHNAMRSLGGSEAAGHLVDAVLTISHPYDLRWSSSVARSVAVYELQLRPAT